MSVASDETSNEQETHRCLLIRNDRLLVQTANDRNSHALRHTDTHYATPQQHPLDSVTQFERIRTRIQSVAWRAIRVEYDTC